MLYIIIGIAILIVEFIKEVTQKPIPPENFKNWKLLGQDSQKVSFGEMSKRQFDKNLRNGKYR